MKTWFITGSSSGIGKGIAKAVLEKGDNAVIMARDIKKLGDLVQAYPERTLSVSLELTDKESIRNAVKAAEERFSSIDVLVNNAGHGYRAAVEEGEESEKGTKGQENGVSGAVRSRFLQASPSRRHGPPQRFSIPAFPCARRDPAPFPG